MDVEFRNICNESVVIQLLAGSTVSDACQKICQKLEIQNCYIFLISPNLNQNFYKGTDMMQDIIQENPEFVLYTKHNKLAQSNEAKNSLKLPPRSFYDDLCHSKKILLHHSTYMQYSNALNEPSDFQDRVNQIAEFGFLIQDIKESLRLSNYEIDKATNMLKLWNSNKLLINHQFEFNKDTKRNDISCTSKPKKIEPKPFFSNKTQKKMIFQMKSSDFSPQSQKSCGRVCEIWNIRAESSQNQNSKKISKIWNQSKKQLISYGIGQN